ncbi:MAG TPA: hypothetical protein PK095_00440 [Myxococcota bacterium]|nr:hypothetical protein [Myxococcota bacterium]
MNSSPTTISRDLRPLAAILTLGTLAIFVAILAAGHRVIPDDVFFYLEIADRIVDGEGSTFSGLMPTNGYHPLWMGMNVTLRAIFGEDPATRVSALLVATALGNLAAIALAFRLTRQLGLSLFLAPVLIAAYTSANHLGSELHLSLPLLLASLGLTLTLVQRPTRRPTHLFGLGLLFGLTALARLDNAFCIAALGLVALDWRGPRKTLIRDAALIGLGGALVLAPYFAWNLATFGHLIPISGAVKSGLAALDGPTPAKMGSQGLLLFALCIFAPLYFWKRARRNPPDTPERRSALIIVAFALGALAHGLYVLFKGQAVWTWYFATELITASLFVTALFDRLLAPRAPDRAHTPLSRLHRFATPATTLLAAGLLALIFVKYLRVDPGPRWYEEAAAWIDREVPPSGAVVTTNSPGGIAFFAARPVMALDGLTGDFAWHERAAAVGLYASLRERGVTHVVSMGDAQTVAPWIARTRQVGHGGEGPTFEGELRPDQTADLERVGMFSGIVHRQVGWLATRPDNLTSRCPCGLAMWRLAPANDPPR